MNEELLISKCRVKTFLRQNGVRVSTDFYTAFDQNIKKILLKAVERSKGNGRSTINSRDI